VNPAGAVETVLVVDDQPIDRTVLSVMLRTCGVDTVLEAEGGAAALDLLRERRVSLVCCDLTMPGMDGVQFIRELATMRPVPALLLISGAEAKVLSMTWSLAARLGINVVGAAQKPVSLEDLRAALAAPRRVLRAVPPNPPLAAPDLRAAIDGGQIELHYLPKVRVSDGQPVGVEALARWRHPAHGLLGPEHFIQLAERSGLIWDLTRRVSRDCVTQAAAWHRNGLPLSVAINMSAAGIGGLDYPDTLRGLCEEAGVDPSKVLLELTETQMEAWPEVYEIIARLRLQGFQLSIDDYGTGNSSLDRLRRLPFAELKIDRSLVDGASASAELALVLESSVRLGQQLGMTVIAEGVEHAADWRLLERLGCAGAQGFLISPPLAAGRVPAWIAQWRYTKTALSLGQAARASGGGAA
jgi:EAL domain-containing protein (putative c-di-GMP-specific phosphodiesterase class I)/CheY-like chemotaxis protein